MYSLKNMSRERKLKSVLTMVPLIPTAFIMTLLKLRKFYHLKKRRLKANNKIIPIINRLRRAKRHRISLAKRQADDNCKKYVM